MVKRNRTEIAGTPDKQLSKTASTRSNTRISQGNADDDVIGTLANAYENKRARQVTEWERAQPQYLRRSA